MSAKIRFVVATRASREEFFRKTATGRSLVVYNFPFIELVLFDQNQLGLPVVYNRAIAAAEKDPAILVFIHDDVHLCDFFLADQIFSALTEFELVGLAGNKRRVPNQPAWAYVDTKLSWDAKENLSGVVGHGQGFPAMSLNVFGASCQEVKLLDGLMLVCHSNTLLKTGVKFDERFSFHFYDMDLCRQAESKNIKMGTWPISVVHESGGAFGSDAWNDGYRKYIEKWRE